MIKAQEIVAFIDEEECNILDQQIKGVCSLDSIKPNCLLFYNSDNELLLSEEEKKVLKTCLVLVKKKELLPKDTPCIITVNPRLAFAQIVNEFFVKKPQVGIHPTAIIDDAVVIPQTVTIGKYSIIENDVEIGEHTVIDNHVIIKSGTKIGEHVHVKNGSVLGDEGFGFEFDINNTPIRIGHVGGLVIKDNVEIGNYCVIDKGTIDNTVIESNVKINDFSKVAHNVYIGENSMIIGAKINGSVRIGQDCWIAPGVVIQNKVKIGSGSMIGTGSVVVRDIPERVVAYGNPAKVVRNK
jgi:UDP-3-O-[3-hydroxymyristoyl] glucosamine N-acyltransferase